MLSLITNNYVMLVSTIALNFSAISFVVHSFLFIRVSSLKF